MEYIGPAILLCLIAIPLFWLYKDAKKRDREALLRAKQREAYLAQREAERQAAKKKLVDTHHRHPPVAPRKVAQRAPLKSVPRAPSRTGVIRTYPPSPSPAPAPVQDDNTLELVLAASAGALLGSIISKDEPSNSCSSSSTDNDPFRSGGGGDFGGGGADSSWDSSSSSDSSSSPSSWSDS